MTEPEVRYTYSFEAEGTVTVTVDWNGAIYVNGVMLHVPEGVPDPEVDWDARAEPAPPPIQVRQCPCGANVDIVDGRWGHHHHDHRDAVCPMSGWPLDGDLSVLTDAELRELANLDREAYGTVSARLWSAIEERWALEDEGPVATPYPWLTYVPGEPDERVERFYEDLNGWRRVTPVAATTYDVDDEGHSEDVQRIIDELRAERTPRRMDGRPRPTRWPWSHLRDWSGWR